MIEIPELTSDQVSGHYDELDEYYRRLWCDHLHHGLWIRGSESITVAVEQLIEHVVTPLGLQGGDDIGDIGCGYGATSRYLVEHYDARVTGLTISKAQYEYACGRSAETGNPQFRLEDWEHSTLASESWDGAVSIECVSHIKCKPRFFEQLQRVLKPGKRASITVWLSSEDPSEWQVRHLLRPICREGRLPSMGSATDYRQWIERCGLTLVSQTDLTASVRKTWFICCRRVMVEFITSREARQFLRRGQHTVFALTVVRILAAYYVGAMRYGHFVIEKS